MVSRMTISDSNATKYYLVAISTITVIAFISYSLSSVAYSFCLPF